MECLRIEQDDKLYLINGASGPRLVPCHSYLLIEENRGLLIDPGPAEDFTAIFSTVTSHIPCEELDYIILTSESPDAASGLLRWEQSGFTGLVVLSWQCYLSARFYAPGMNYHTLSGRDEGLRLGGDRLIGFYQFPGMPSLGSQVCWDSRSGTLFSGNLFGAVHGGNEDETTLPLTSGSLPGRMASYDEIYLPRTPSRTELQILYELGVRRICPHHGYPLDEAALIKGILTGSAGPAEDKPVRETELDPAAARATIVRLLRRRLEDLFPSAETTLALKEGPNPEPEGRLSTEEYGYFFELILKRKGYTWLALIHPELRRLSDQFGLPLPALISRDEREIAGGIDALLKEMRSLKDSNFHLQQSIIEASDDLLRDNTTGFYNESFFCEYVNSSIQGESWESDSVLFIRLDDIRNLNSRYGADAGDQTLQALANFLMNHKRESVVFFRLNGPTFAGYLHGGNKETAIEYAGELKLQAERSQEFIAPITISIAVLAAAELKENGTPQDRFYTEMMKTGKERLKILDRLGPSSICSSSHLSLFRRSAGTVLLIESNEFEAGLYRRILEQSGFEVFHSRQGTQALARADEVRPDVIVSEIFVAQMDGFQIRRRLLDSQDLKEIPFIILSREKSEASVQRGYEMRIVHHFRKPVMPAELTGAVKALIRAQEPG